MTVDIIVPTYNRPVDLKRFIQEIGKQTYARFKVYIIDDNSDYPLRDLVPNTPLFTYFKLDANRGQTFARNYALEHSQGEVVILLDDDAWFKDFEAIGRVVEYFFEDPNLGCLMFDLQEPGKELLSKQKKLRDKNKIGSFIACACAFRREAILAISGFTDFLHSYGEETDVTLKLLTNKYDLVFSDQVQVYHNYHPGERSKEWYLRFRKNSVRNDLLIVMMRFPCLTVPPYLFGKFFSHLFFTIRFGRNLLPATFATFFGLFSALYFSPKAFRLRKPIPFKLFRTWLKLRW